MSHRPSATVTHRPTPAAVLSEPEQAELDHLVGEWLNLAELAQRLGTPVNKARTLLVERQLIGIRRGPARSLAVPAEFLDASGHIVKGLPGLLTVLADAGFDDVQTVRWLFTPDDSLPGTPLAGLSTHRGKEVKRRAQAAAL